LINIKKRTSENTLLIAELAEMRQIQQERQLTLNKYDMDIQGAA
jgi:hypothetical protein